MGAEAIAVEAAVRATGEAARQTIKTAEVLGGALLDGMRGLYKVAGDVNDFMNEHIKEMQASKNPSVAKTGRVLESAKVGFGVGYAAPVVIIVSGQLLLGNPLSAISAAGTALTLTNPLAMTCAAVGAIYYGWNALSQEEQDALLKQLSDGLQVGIEFIRAIIRFVVEKTKELFSEKNTAQLKKSVETARKEVKNFIAAAMEITSDSFADAVMEVRCYWIQLKTVVQLQPSYTKKSQTLLPDRKPAR